MSIISIVMIAAGNRIANTLFIPNKKADPAESQVGSGGFWYLGSPFKVVSNQLESCNISRAVTKFLASIIFTHKASRCAVNSTIQISVSSNKGCSLRYLIMLFFPDKDISDVYYQPCAMTYK